MTTDNSLNDFPPLRAEVDRALRLRAWKDETFRQELIANPKGVAQRLFPECFPNGKVPEQVTYKVLEEDQYTHHIVLPALPDEFLAPEVPEEVQLALIANWAVRTLRIRQIATGMGLICLGTHVKDRLISSGTKMESKITSVIAMSLKREYTAHTRKDT